MEKRSITINTLLFSCTLLDFSLNTSIRDILEKSSHHNNSGTTVLRQNHVEFMINAVTIHLKD